MKWVILAELVVTVALWGMVAWTYYVTRDQSADVTVGVAVWALAACVATAITALTALFLWVWFVTSAHP